MVVNEYAKPLPKRTALNAPFFEGSLEGRLRLQQGLHSGRAWFPYSPVDPVDLSPEFEWRDMSGRATLWSWIVMHQQYFAAFADDLPYTVIFVKIEEGPMMISTIPDDVDPATLRLDMPMRAEFAKATKEFARVVFRPLAE